MFKQKILKTFVTPVFIFFMPTIVLAQTLANGTASIGDLPKGTKFTLLKPITVPAGRSELTMLEATSNMDPNRIPSDIVQDQCFVQVIAPTALPVTIPPQTFVLTEISDVILAHERCTVPACSVTDQEDVWKKLRCSANVCQRSYTMQFFFGSSSTLNIACNANMKLSDLLDATIGLFSVEMPGS